MPRDLIQQSIRELRSNALTLRRIRNAVVDYLDDPPEPFASHMTSAAQSLDDAANTLLETYGDDLPDGAL